jgi:hypothetical protein
MQGANKESRAMKPILVVIGLLAALLTAHAHATSPQCGFIEDPDLQNTIGIRSRSGLKTWNTIGVRSYILRGDSRVSGISAAD